MIQHYKDYTLEHISHFLPALLNTFNEQFLKNFPKKNQLSWAKKELTNRLSINVPKTVKIRNHKYSPFFPQAKEDHFKEVVYSETEVELIMGIRFLSGNKEKPFVEVLPKFQPTHAKDIEDIKRAVLKYFSVFQPQFIQLLIPTHQDLMLNHKVNIVLGNQLVVGHIEDILKTPVKTKSDLTLEKVEDTKYKEWYENEYSYFHKANPELKDWVPITTNEDMECSKEQGLLYRGVINDRTVGLIAAEKYDLLDTPSLYMNEIVLSHTAKGKGYAPEMQRQFLKRVSEKYQLVWGTIDSKNIPSLKTAFRVGRKAVRTEIFIKIN